MSLLIHVLKVLIVMNKAQYLDSLHRELDNYLVTDIFRHISEYDIIIDSLIEEGLNEDQILEKIGHPDCLALEIANEFDYKLKDIAHVNSNYKRVKSSIATILNIIFIVILISYLFIFISTYMSIATAIILLKTTNTAFILLNIVSFISFTYLLIIMNKLRRLIVNKLKERKLKISFGFVSFAFITSFVVSILLSIYIFMSITFGTINGITSIDASVIHSKLQDFTNTFIQYDDTNKDTQIKPQITLNSDTIITPDLVFKYPSEVYTLLLTSDSITFSGDLSLVGGVTIPSTTYDISLQTPGTSVTISNKENTNVQNISKSSTVIINDGDIVTFDGDGVITLNLILN